jgi:hypothetical protein
MSINVPNKTTVLVDQLRLDNMFVDIDIHVQHSTTTAPFNHEAFFDSLKSHMRGPRILRIFFDPASAPKSATFTKDNRHVTKHNDSVSTDCFMFCDKTLEETRGKPWGFTVDVEGSWLGVGAGMKDKVIELRPNWPWQKPGHGTYVLGYNGWRLHHTNAAINDGAGGFNFTKGDELVLQYDIYNQKLKAKNKRDGSTAELPEVPSNAHLMVVIFGGNNEMSIVDQNTRIEEI